VACGNDRQFERLAHAIGRPELALDARFASNAGRVQAREALVPLLAECFAAHPRGHWIEVLSAVGVPATPVATLREALDDPQTAARGLVQHVEHAQAGRLPLLASPFGEHAVAPSPPPAVGEHTRAVLREVLALDEASLDALQRDGVIVERAAAGTDAGEGGRRVSG